MATEYLGHFRGLLLEDFFDFDKLTEVCKAQCKTKAATQRPAADGGKVRHTVHGRQKLRDQHPQTRPEPSSGGWRSQRRNAKTEALTRAQPRNNDSEGSSTRLHQHRDASTGNSSPQLERVHERATAIGSVLRASNADIVPLLGLRQGGESGPVAPPAQAGELTLGDQILNEKLPR